MKKLTNERNQPKKEEKQKTESKDKKEVKPEPKLVLPQLAKIEMKNYKPGKRVKNLDYFICVNSNFT